MTKVTSGVYRCNAGFVGAAKNGGRVQVAVGALVPYDVPYDVMEGREHLFDDVSQPRQRSGVVEQATAAPGEKRTTRKS